MKRRLGGDVKNSQNIPPAYQSCEYFATFYYVNGDRVFVCTLFNGTGVCTRDF